MNEKFESSNQNVQSSSWDDMPKESWTEHLAKVVKSKFSKEKHSDGAYHAADNLEGYKRELAKKWDKQPPYIPEEVGKVVEQYVNDPDCWFGIHRSSAVDGANFENDEVLESIMQDGLLNLGNASSGAIQDNSSLSNTVAVCNDMLNAEIYLKSPYKGSTGSILVAVPREYVNEDGKPKPGMNEEVYIKDRYGRSVLKPEFIKGFVSNVPGEEICQYRSRDELMQKYSEKESN